jgi:hypothetical protein
MGGVIHTKKGPIIDIFNQYAHLNKGSSKHSPCQFEWHKNDFNNKSILVPGGLQRIQTLDGYVIPLSIQYGLARLNLCPYTDQEFDTLPHVILTLKLEWDPSVLDHIFIEDEQWGDAQLLCLNLMKLAITHNALYCIIILTLIARMVPPQKSH